jgi:sterol desaturase/sphingolipid hydroxylase (fatty acid hydroxylase superfamily)
MIMLIVIIAFVTFVSHPMPLKQVQVIILAAVFALQFLFEHIFPQRRTLNDWKNERMNIGIGLLNLLLSLIPAHFFVQGIAFFESNGWGLLHQFSMPFALNLLLTILLMDFWMYIWHRMNHRLPFLWQFHRFHHKDTKMNSTTAVRFHIVELYLSYPAKAAVCLLLGISYLPLLIYETLFFTAVVIHHSNIAISEKADSVYRLLFASPGIHRIHHSNRLQDTNSNYGSLFSFWDRLLGSWRGGYVAPVHFGIPPEDSE